MIKPVLKYCIPIYLLLAYITLAVAKGTMFPLAAFLIASVLIVVIVVLGLVIGMIISVLFRMPNHERKFYWIGQMISVAFLVTTFIQAFLTDNRPKRSMAEENEVTIRELTDTITRPFVLRAFENLKSKFNSPNDLEINSVTELQNAEGFTVYFSYNLNNNPSKEYYSKYDVGNVQAKLIEFNLDTRSTAEYLQIRKQHEKTDSLVDKLEKMSK
jgi:hypothetical protein